MRKSPSSQHFLREDYTFKAICFRALVLGGFPENRARTNCILCTIDTGACKSKTLAATVSHLLESSTRAFNLLILPLYFNFQFLISRRSNKETTCGPSIQLAFIASLFQARNFKSTSARCEEIFKIQRFSQTRWEKSRTVFRSAVANLSKLQARIRLFKFIEIRS